MKADVGALLAWLAARGMRLCEDVCWEHVGVVAATGKGCPLGISYLFGDPKFCKVMEEFKNGY